MMYKFLEPIKIGNIVLKNRIVYLAMAKYLSTDDFFITKRQTHYYKSIAEGGTGLIIPGAMIVDGDWPSKFPRQPGIFNDTFIPGLKELVDNIHELDAKIFFQLWHPGIAAYGCKTEDLKGVAEFTVKEIAEIQKKYVQAALRAKKAGADGVEVHIAHNYLAEQFLVPLFNNRMDRYGADTVENGIRFSLEIIEGIHDACGSDYPLIAKINGDDFTPEGMTIERAVKASVYLEKSGVSMISVNAGGSLTKITGMSGDGYCEEGWKVPLAQAVKGEVNIPVCAIGSLRHPQYVDRMIKEGKCDVVGIGRGIFSDFQWVNKAAENREAEIAYCVNCMHCFTPFRAGEGACTMNPIALEEPGATDLNFDGCGRTVCIIGAGPAGMQAAFTLAERGFKLIVIEKKGRIGGMVNYAAVNAGKERFSWITDYYYNKAEALNVEIRLNTMATVELLKEIEPYAIIVATGSIPVESKVLGTNHPHVYQVQEFLERKVAIVKKKVIIIGSGATGLETAVTLKLDGNDVVVLDQMRELPNTRDMQFLLAHIKSTGVILKLGYKLSEITHNQIIVKNPDTGEECRLDADVVILSMGVQSDTVLFEELNATFPKVFRIGDCVRIGKIADAIKNAFHCAQMVD